MENEKILDLSSICTELTAIEIKLIALHELLNHAVIHEFGDYKPDIKLNGIGEIIKDQALRLGELAKMIDHHSVT